MKTVVGKKSSETFRLDPRAELGRGGEGIVYRAPGGRCVKLFPAPLPATEVEKIGALTALSKTTPGYAWPLEVANDASTGEPVAVVFPLAPGRNFESVLDDRMTADTPPETKIQIAFNVAVAVARAHALRGPRVVLGDVMKSANIMLDGEAVTFVDTTSVSLFGYRKLNGDTGDAVNRLTTPGSVPPEVVGTPHAIPSHAADRFALAVLLFEVVFGKPPYQPKPCAAAIGRDPNDLVKARVFPRYTNHPEFEPPDYDPIDVPDAVDELFRAAFLSVTDRPDPDRWCGALAWWRDALRPAPAAPAGPGPKVWAAAAAVLLLGALLAGAAAYTSRLAASPTAPLPRTPLGPPVMKEVFP